jgi:hypothetical protein
MSADAKVWQEEDGRSWKGTHDGECRPDALHDYPGLLTETLQSVEKCMGHELRWELRVYENGLGLSGWLA